MFVSRTVDWSNNNTPPNNTPPNKTLFIGELLYKWSQEISKKSEPNICAQQLT